MKPQADLDFTEKTQSLIDRLYKQTPLEIVNSQLAHRDAIQLPQFSGEKNYRRFYWETYTQNIVFMSQLKELVLENYL